MSLRSLLPLGLLLFLAFPTQLHADKASKKERSISHGELGRAYLSEGNFEAAIESLRQAAELDRTNWAAWTFLGLALAERGAAEEAEKAFNTALRYAPERAEPHSNYAMFLFGQGRIDEAVAHYELALEDLTYRKPTLIMSNLGFALLTAGDHGRAVTVLEEALQRSPTLCPARFNLGLAHESAGADELAIAAFRETLEMCGEEVPGTYVHLARLLAARGELAEATTYLYRAMDLAPGTDIASEAESILAAMER